LLESLPAILKAFSNGAAALAALADWRAKTRGNARALVEELKENARCCLLVLEDDVPIEQVIERFATSEYDRLGRAGFDFNSLRRSRIERYASLEGTELASWRGKPTEQLVVSIYDKIKDLRAHYPHAKESERRRWRVRVANIHKRILLLLLHAHA